jgi:aminoglycoside 6-adenylyltransferase
MRYYKEVIEQILQFANNETRLKIVMLNGSRVNKNAPIDIMQDYDIVFFITNIKDEYYKKNTHWINQLGELVMFQ